MSKSPDTDISEVRERLEAYVREPRITASARELAEAIRALLSDHAGLVAEVERLKKVWQAAQRGADRFAHEADVAESALAASKAREEALVEIIQAVLQVDREALADHRPKWGLADSVDNDGRPYQSHYLGEALERARALISKRGRDDEPI